MFNSNNGHVCVFNAVELVGWHGSSH